VQVSHLPWLAAACIGSIALTEIRLVLLAWNETSYQWWHNGSGVTVYTLALLGLAVLCPILATPGPPAEADRGVVRGAA
jgi:hypothetical protein